VRVMISTGSMSQHRQAYLSFLIVLQDVKMHLLSDLKASRKDLKHLSVTNAKDTRKKSGNVRSVACQCRLIHVSTSAADGRRSDTHCGSLDLCTHESHHTSSHLQCSTAGLCHMQVRTSPCHVSRFANQTSFTDIGEWQIRHVSKLWGRSMASF
jgi:hypothetical protein